MMALLDIVQLKGVTGNRGPLLFLRLLSIIARLFLREAPLRCNNVVGGGKWLCYSKPPMRSTFLRDRFRTEPVTRCSRLL
jgi:hypothetical protein